MDPVPWFLKAGHMKYLSEINTAHSFFGLRDDGVIVAHPIAGYEGGIDEAEAAQMVAAMKELCSDGPKPMMMRIGDNKLTNGARNQLIARLYPTMIAFVGTTWLARTMSNVLFRFKKLPVPVKLFRREDNALAWIRAQQAASVRKANGSVKEKRA